MTWKLAVGLVFAMLLAGCRVFVTPIPALPTLPLPVLSTADPALLGTLVPAGQRSESHTPTPAPVLSLSSQRYTSPQSTFSLNPPAGWTVEQNDTETRWNDPDGSSWISLRVLNTSYTYDQDSFTRLVSAREENTFASLHEYGELERTIQVDQGTATVVKGVVLDQKEKRILSYYLQDGSAVLALDCWMDVDLFESYRKGFESIISTLQFDGQAAASTTIVSIKVYQDEQNQVAFEVPDFWTYVHLGGEKTASDTFSAPDLHAAIQSLVYEDQAEVDRSLAGEFTLTLLREFYDQDIVITRDSMLVDDSERLDWYSPAGKYHGATVFRVRGNTIWLTTVIVDDEYQSTYQDLLERILASALFT